VAEPLSVTVFDYGTGTKSTKELMKIVKENFDLRPGRIVKDLKLKNPIFQQSATYGHFGRDIFTWEQPKTLKFWETEQRILDKLKSISASMFFLVWNNPSIMISLISSKYVQLGNRIVNPALRDHSLPGPTSMINYQFYFIESQLFCLEITTGQF